MAIQTLGDPPPSGMGLHIEPVSLQQLHSLLDHLRGIVGYFDTANRCVYANHAYASAYHTTVREMTGNIFATSSVIRVGSLSSRILSVS